MLFVSDHLLIGMVRYSINVWRILLPTGLLVLGHVLKVHNIAQMGNKCLPLIIPCKPIVAGQEEAAES